MTVRTNLICKFIKGENDYINTDVGSIEVTPLPNVGIKSVVRVAHPNGEWIKSGEAFKTSSGVELVYHTISDGDIAFEQYGCELQFILKEMPFDPQLKFSLKKVCHLESPPNLDL